MMKTQFLLVLLVVSCTSQEFQEAVPLAEPVFEIAVPLVEPVVDEKIAAPTGGPATEIFTLPPDLAPEIPAPLTCPPTPCFGQAVLNPVTCNCDCALTDETCPGPRGYANYNTCECQQRPCDPVWPCPRNQVISWELCRCFDETTTSTTRCAPIECGKRSIWSQKDCRCVCKSQPCRRGFIWKADPICRCELKCNYVGKCMAGYRWDFIKCDCVRLCPDLVCRRGQVINYNTCQCTRDLYAEKALESPQPIALN